VLSTFGRLSHGDGGVGGPPRSVLDRLQPEGRDHAGWPQLLDPAAEALHLVNEDLDGSRDRRPEVAIRRKDQHGS